MGGSGAEDVSRLAKPCHLAISVTDVLGVGRRKWAIGGEPCQIEVGVSLGRAFVTEIVTVEAQPKE